VPPGNNTCIQSAPNLTAYSFAFCDPAKPNNITNLGILHDNRVYNPDGKSESWIQIQNNASSQQPVVFY